VSFVAIIRCVASQQVFIVVFVVVVYFVTDSVWKLLDTPRISCIIQNILFPHAVYLHPVLLIFVSKSHKV